MIRNFGMTPRCDVRTSTIYRKILTSVFHERIATPYKLDHRDPIQTRSFLKHYRATSQVVRSIVVRIHSCRWIVVEVFAA